MTDQPKKSWKIPEKEINKSPLPSKEQVKEPEKVGFVGALVLIKGGSKVTRVEWDSTDVYGLLKNGVLMVHKEDDKFYNWIISEVDLDSKDFYELK